LKKLASLLVLAVVVCLQSAQAQRPPDTHVVGRLIVQHRLDANPSAVNQVLSANGARVMGQIPQIHVSVLQVAEQAADKVAAALAHSGQFTFIERDMLAKTGATTPNDPYFGSQWHLATIQAPNAWGITTGTSATAIAVIDSGVDTSHADLAPKLAAGWNFLTGTSAIVDNTGHGTATSGTIAADTNNGVGVAGVAWGNMIMPLVVVDSTGSASYSNIASAITYAADHGARIMNISIAGSSASSTLQSAVNYAWNKGAVIFASAGNYSTSAPYYPAACDNVVAVSATDSTDLLASYSNFGSWIDLSAPGSSIMTTSSGSSYGSWSGTSFSAPVAAGVAALVLAERPSLSAAALVSLLEQNSDDLGAPGYDTSFGYGRVNAYRAVLAAQNLPASDTIPPSVSITSPGTGATVSGSVQVQGTATDNVGVTGIQFLLDGQLVSSSAGSPFSFAWNTLSATNGSHTLTVTAVDAAANKGSASVTVSVNNPVVVDTTPPVVTITGPANGSTVSRTATITVSATDNVAVHQVCIYIDGVLKVTDTAAPYTYSWNTKKSASGVHTIKATAWDAAGNSSSATITVNN
jgi:subtilisin family serine protease